MAAHPRKRRLTDEQCRALQLLATNLCGLTEEVLMLAHGFDSDMLTDLVRAKLAKRHHLTVKGGGRAIRVTYMRIRAAGRKAIAEQEMMAVSPHRPRLTLERRRALKLLASSRHGENEESLVLGHGFKRQMLVGLVRARLAAAEREMMVAGGNTIEVIRIRITNAGWRAIEE